MEKQQTNLVKGLTLVTMFTLYFDTEDDHDWLLLHPDLRTVAKPLEGCFWSQDLTILRVDAYCAESLHLSHLPTMEF